MRDKEMKQRDTLASQILNRHLILILAFKFTDIDDITAYTFFKFISTPSLKFGKFLAHC